MTNPSLAQHFADYFEVVPVNDALTRREVFRLRYAVYCEELAYEDKNAFPDGEERDDFDSDSEFALLRHRSTGRAAGCVRLIRTARTPDLTFPFERVCAGQLDPTLVDLNQLDRSRIGEISRLAVHQDFRRRKGESETPEGGTEPADQFGGNRRYPLVAMGLFLSASALALIHDVDQVLVMMEPRLARLLQSCGIQFTQVGEVIDYHGRRGPFQITQQELLRNLTPDSEALLNALVGALK
jgi:N-acyl amino acid synthase of PEP-CTERM/exosortase system